jgi:hypothetical protein
MVRGPDRSGQNGACVPAGIALFGSYEVLDHLDRDGACDLAAAVATHPVGHDEKSDVGCDTDAVLVLAAFTPDVCAGGDS